MTRNRAALPHVHRRRMRSLSAVLLMWVSSLGCSREPATQQQCQLILDRIVELELAEMGFADPVLLGRTQAEVRGRYRTELEACVGKPISEDAMDCAMRAQSAEELSHDCMK